ncbi:MULTISPECIES: FkbM family methyltransferase [Spirulina sp. CCY15215]|uniref:FkbM family methyltransferase n=1 Tax=Spirulina sp. CCY15215 TaxID=2767591 RepID=UPI00194DF31E
MLKILHITQCLTRGGAGRSLIATAKYSAGVGYYQHQVISLLPAQTGILALIQDSSLSLIDAPSRKQILEEIQKADIVQVHFWNNPHIYEFLRSLLPPMRLLVWVHCAGNLPPQIITKKLVCRSDTIVGCSPYTWENLASLNLSSEEKKKLGMVFAGTDFDRCVNIKPKPHNSFNIGYMGTVDFVKMHPDYIRMSANIDIPKVKIITVGKGRAENELKQQVIKLSLDNKFEFIDYVEDPKTILEILDVFGYPLCEETYAASELVLQEAMYCGIPPVVFPYGGVKRLVVHNQTGLIVNNSQEYKEAIEYLYHHPEERARLGNNAREYAMQNFGAENAIKALHSVYEEMMQQPKRRRIWGMPSEVSLLHQPIAVEDLTGEIKALSGAECFVESLGDTAPQFKISLTSENTEALLESDLAIAQSSLLLRSAGSGGVLHYSSHYPNDSYLKLWSGLIYRQLGQYSQAVSEFSSAIELGCKHWRVLLYLALVAERANNIILAQQVAMQLIQTQSNVAVVRKTHARLFNYPILLQPLVIFFMFFWLRVLQKSREIVNLLKHSIKSFLKFSLSQLDLEITHKSSIPEPPPPSPRFIERSSLAGCLQQVAKNSFIPQTIIDVGAAFGTSPLYETFPDACHIFIEPLEEFIPSLQSLVSQLDRAEYLIAVAGKNSGNMTINVHPDLIGSSLYLETEDSDVNGIERTVPAVTLDEICRDQKTQAPYLIKIDTQGSELDVLQGATEILPKTELVILEISCFEFFKSGPQFYDCIKFMQENGFVVYDLFGLQYRPLDGALSQIDIAFVRKNSKLRKYQFYATREQRDKQTQKLLSKLKNKQIIS